MTDDYQSMLAGLDDEPAEEKPKPAKKPARRRTAKPAGKTVDASGSSASRTREAGKSEQRGARADPNMTQVNASIRKELKASLFYYLKAEGKTLSEVIEEKIEEYVAERGGVIKPPKPKPRT